MNDSQRRVVSHTGAALLLTFAMSVCAGPAGAAASANAAGNTGTPAGKIKVGIAYGIGGRGDQALNDSAAAGLDRAVRKLRLGPSQELEASVSDSDADLENLLRKLARSGHNPVIAVGFYYDLAVLKVAEEYPRTTFAIVDDESPRRANISNLVFAENEAAFLAGAAAALKSDTRHIGFLGGVKVPLIQRYQAGFQAGARAVDHDIQIDARYITMPPDFSGFNSPDQGRSKARALFDKGADVVFHAAERSGQGVFAAAKAAGGMAIGCDFDQARSADARVKDVILTSAVKKADVAVYDFLKRFLRKEARHGVTVYGLKAGAVGYATTGGRVNDIKATLDAFARKIAKGEIRVPTKVS
ncbi:BMP family lipoprotein [Microtetraspora fusca]|uniref:BMP family lipoprotein n=1 Tax=Microtetraspora fusca TaxID=1997 RepID=UPI000833F61C|nr:BMP family ABC transporter substrate-binding protein [Microtetraspora fusca]